MKHFIYYFIFFFLWACGSGDSSGENGIVADLNFTLDTVKIDSKGEILFLNNELRSAVLDDKKQYLYNLNRQTFSIEKIDLDKLALASILPFEENGPNGLGDYMYGIKLVDGDRFLMSGYRRHALFDSSGNKLSSVGPWEIPTFVSSKEEGNVLFPERLPGTTSSYVGVYIAPGNREPAVLFWDIDEKTYRKVKNPLLKKSIQYQTDFDDGTTSLFVGGGEYLKVINEKVLLGLFGSSDLSIMEAGEKAFHKKTFENGWIPREKETVFPEKINDRLLFQELLRESLTEISYTSPFWDESRQVYLRFSYEMEFSQDVSPSLSQLIPKPSSVKVYLSVYDGNFNLLRESHVPVLDKAPSHHFAKDGKIWIFENMEDEMGFVRLEFDL
ncbi:DUF4221 family protein [Cyclobacterium sp. 1_MG-2023]|uniref:DUF4221 family protein n=1 Tax=Cyclobacterium sp. 1_MG-2023 TaxID=3062681 RepID=UPI0026E3825D|nr:DUF4221 family protein [Cyclobacterium sp. 1_MG-2023]MDO6438187.1 DUF4221 family protein [Cyclobacterium sp. 1_MG-2023]